MVKLSEFAELLLEFQGLENDTLEVYANRLLLRVFNCPSLLSYLAGVKVVQPDTVELVFYRIPDDEVTNVKNLCGPAKVEIKTFKVDSKPRIAYIIKPQGIRDDDDGDGPRRS